MLALQRGAGNASVTGMLARAPAEVEEVQARDAVVEPHEGGSAGVLAPPAQADAGAFDWLNQALSWAPPDKTPAATATADKAVTDWQARKLTTNAEYAQWVLDGEAQGFVTFTPGMGSKAQMTDLAAGKKVSGVDPAQASLLEGLVTIHGLVGARVTRWVADPTTDKNPLAVGSFIRPTGHRGQAIDLNGLDWTGPGGPGQVAAMLQDLPAGNYGIGLPFQGEFFPASLNLDTRMQAAQTKAGDGVPEAITDTSLQKFTTHTYTASWNAEKKPEAGWDVDQTGGRAVDHLKSADLKKAITDLNSAPATRSTSSRTTTTTSTSSTDKPLARLWQTCSGTVAACSLVH